MDTRPIGVFDSGLGGLTAVRELIRCLPGEDIVYFGDTGRVPYGTRSRETLEQYARQDIQFLLKHDVKLIVVACATVSSILRPEMLDGASMPCIGVIEPTAKAAVEATRNGRIGVTGTPATIGSGSFKRALQALNPEIEAVYQACALLVPLVETGWVSPEDPITRLTLERYLEPVRAAGADTIILGCTHYPLLRPAIEQMMPEVQLIDAGQATAAYAAKLLAEQDLLQPEGHVGEHRYYVSDTVDRFEEIGSAFLGADLRGQVQRIHLEQYLAK